MAKFLVFGSSKDQDNRNVWENLVAKAYVPYDPEVRLPTKELKDLGDLCGAHNPQILLIPEQPPAIKLRVAPRALGVAITFMNILLETIK